MYTYVLKFCGSSQEGLFAACRPDLAESFDTLALLAQPGATLVGNH